MIFNEGSKVIVDEAYVGRTPEIQKFYNDFSKLRDKYVGSRKVPTPKECEVIEKHMEKIFGFKAVHFEVEINDDINACTYPVCSDIFMDTSQLFVTTKSGGYKYTKAAKAATITIITRGCFNNENITNEECFAVLLHEIGHSFVTRSSGLHSLLVIDAFLTIFKLAIDLINFNIDNATNTIVGIGVSTNTAKSLMICVQNEIDKHKLLVMLGNGYHEIMNIIGKIYKSIIYIIKTPKRVKFCIPNFILGKCIELIYKILGGSFGRSKEYLSDDFAVVYGFGPELATALPKLSDPRAAYHGGGIPVRNALLSDKGIIGWTFRFIEKMSMEFGYAIDPHPKEEKRVQAIRKSLIDELEKNKDLNPKVKAELKDNIVKIAMEAEEIEKSNKYLMEHKDEAIIAVKELVKQNKALDPDWGEQLDINKTDINIDFKDRLVD